MKVPSYRILIGLMTLALIGAGTYLVAAPAAAKSATAYFGAANGIHADDEVRVLGVRVGSVDEIEPEGTRVRVRFHYDAKRKVPAEAGVALVAPTLVSGRYLQLAPVYRGGAVMGDGAVIPRERTAEPQEWDQVNGELTKLAQALGPNGANRQGALSRLLNTTAANLRGNGPEFSRMLHELSSASTTLSGGSEDLFATIGNLAQLTTALNGSRDTLRSFGTQLTSISRLANDNRTQLADAMSAADGALTTVTGFVQRHKDQLGGTVGSLSAVANTLARSRADLANVLHAAPQTMANLYNIYEPSTGSASSRLMLPYTGDLSTLVCQSIFSVGGTLGQCRGALEPLLGKLDTPYPPLWVDPLSRPGTSHQAPPPGGGR